MERKLEKRWKCSRALKWIFQIRTLIVLDFVFEILTVADLFICGQKNLAIETTLFILAPFFAKLTIVIGNLFLKKNRKKYSTVSTSGEECLDELRNVPSFGPCRYFLVYRCNQGGGKKVIKIPHHNRKLKKNLLKAIFPPIQVEY